MDACEQERARRRLTRLARLMDSAVPVPGTGLAIGLDALLGLLPGIGDTLGGVVAGWLLIEAARLGAPRAVLLKMAWNVLLDAVLGTVPVAGDVFDLAWRANLRNLRLLDAWLAEPRRTAAASRLFLWSLLLLLLAAVLLLSLLAVLLLRGVWRLAAGG